MTEAGIQKRSPFNPDDWPEVEVYSPERIAEFLLNNAVSEEDFQAAVEEVISMGIDPATVPHDHY